MKRKSLISFKALIWIGSAVVILAGVLFLAIKKVPAPSQEIDLARESVPYSQPGPYPVGFAGAQIEQGPSLNLKVWYPADCSSGCQAPVTYSYKVKFDRPLGTTSLASYQGSSFVDPANDKSRGPYPLVILSPGFGIGSTSYAWLAEHLASYGFVVISPDHRETLDPQDQLWRSAITRPQEVQSVMTFLDRETSPSGMFEGLIDIELTAVIGHSYGGYTALAAGGARIDTVSFGDTCQSVANTDLPGAWLCQQLIPHIQEMSDLAGLKAVPDGLWPDWGMDGVDALVPFASDALFFGQPGLSQILVPVLAIGGTADQDAPFKWGTGPSYEFSSGVRKAQLALLDGEHMIFTGPCESIRWYLLPLAGEFCSDPGWERSYAHQITRHLTTAFLLAELKGDQDAVRYLSPEMVVLPQFEFTSQGY